MSAVHHEPVTEGYVVKLADGWWQYPNWGPVYGTEAKARRSGGRGGGEVYKVTIIYEKVES